MQRRSSQLNTQRMSVQRSGNCASKPTGNWSLSWFVIDPEMMIEDEMMITRVRIICLDELGQTFVGRLVMRLKYKDGHKTHYGFGRTFL